MGTRADAKEFAIFLDRLRATLSFRDPAFRAQVHDWLAELSKPDRATLLDETLAVCRGGTESCEDRLVATWNDAQNLRRNDDIRNGVYDQRIDEVLDTGGRCSASIY
nr:NEL domain-containing protein [Bordetella genomosp. 9]